MIRRGGGRSHSVRTPEEIDRMLKKEVASLTPAERETLRILLKEMAEGKPTAEEPGQPVGLYNLIGAAEYRQTPVPIREFVLDPYYLGATCDNIYPALLDDLEEIFSGGYQIVVYTGAIGVGKTFLASIGICRVIYEISCLKDPHASFGLAKDSNIAAVCFSVSEELARKVAFENILTKIQASPYFQERFAFKATKSEIRFPNNVWLAPRASTDTSALGLNVISAMLDEAAFLHTRKVMDKVENRAETIYNSVRRRMKSRYERKGKLPGMIFVVSSKKTTEDFTDKIIKESVNDPTVFVRDRALWELRPEQFSSKKFYVLAGSEVTQSRILTDAEGLRLKDNPPEGTVVVEVPVDFENDFKADLEGALRDIAGIGSAALRPYIQRREKIRDAINPALRHPFSTLVYDMSKGGKFEWSRIVSVREERVGGRTEPARPRPLISPRAARHCHIDIGLRRDALGLCIAHVSGWKDVIRRGEDGKEYMDRAPCYTADLILKVIPPIGGEVLLAEVQHLVYEMTSHGYMITKISCDSFQSAVVLQTFASRGYTTELVSVDTTPEPYDTLKMALYEDRIQYYEYPPLIEELMHLQEDYSKNKRKIDHPNRGSKDLGDALAGCVFTLSQQRLQEPVPILRGMAYAPEAWMPEQAQSAMAGNASALNSSNLVPFLAGGGDDDGWNSPWRP